MDKHLFDKAQKLDTQIRQLKKAQNEITFIQKEYNGTFEVGIRLGDRWKTLKEINKGIVPFVFLNTLYNEFTREINILQQEFNEL